MSDSENEGFTEPAAADVPPDDQPEMQLAPDHGAMLDMVADEVDCRNCSHYAVCGIIAAVRPMFDDWQAGDPDDEPPVTPENLALICLAFEPVELPEP